MMTVLRPTSLRGPLGSCRSLTSASVKGKRYGPSKWRTRPLLYSPAEHTTSVKFIKICTACDRHRTLYFCDAKSFAFYYSPQIRFREALRLVLEICNGQIEILGYQT